MRPFRAAIVGTGQIALPHAETIRETAGVTLVGVADVDVGRARAFAERLGTVAFPSLDALADAGTDVVHVCTPPDTHAAVTLDAIERGCHVLVEKPLATRVEDCDRIAEAAARRGVRVAVDHSLLTDPHVRRVLDAVRAGDVGDVVSASYFVSSAYAPWDTGPLPPPYRDGGYPFRDLGVHGLYLLRALLGEIEHVHAEHRTRGGDPNLWLDEWQALVRCRRGTGHIQLSWNVEPHQTQLVVHGTRGSVRADVGLGFSSGRKARPLPSAVTRAANAIEEALPPLVAVPRNAAAFLTGRLRSYEGVRAFVREFYAALAGDRPLPASVDDGRSVVRWTEEIARAGDAEKVICRRRHAPSGLPATVVTGAGGLLGTPLVRRLLDDERRVRILVRRPPPADLAADPRVEVVLGDLGDAALVDELLRGARTVYHLGAAMRGGAAEHARGTVAGTRHVVEGCLAHGIDRLVHVSSLSVLAWSSLDGTTVTERGALETRAGERGHYTQAKLAAERIVLEAVERRALPAVVVRPGQMVGPDGPGPDAANAFAVGRRLLVLGRGAAILPLVDVADVVEALLRAGRLPVAPGAIYHVVGDTGTTQIGLARSIAAARGLRLTRVPQPVVWSLAAGLEVMGRLLGRAMPLSRYRLASAQARLAFDCARARADLGWMPGGPPAPAAPAITGADTRIDRRSAGESADCYTQSGRH